MRVFIVGSGAIGCELLKYLALLGVGQKAAGGNIQLTDDDTISRSNLNRQFLFREKDINHLKSECAARSAKHMNSSVHFIPHKLRLCEDTEEFFDDFFFQQIDSCFSALDSLAARKYLDARCLNQLPAGIPMLDSGTHGLEGHSCPCIPFKTSSYGSEIDPDANESVGCFIQNFPYKPAHCVQWAKMIIFDDDFISFPATLNQLLDDLKTLDPTSPFAALKTYMSQNEVDAARFQIPLKICGVLKLFQMTDYPFSFQKCVEFARSVWERLYREQPANLLYNFPPDLIANGQPFWGPPKRPPTPQRFDPSDLLTAQFVIGYAHLWADVWKIPHHRISDPEIMQLASRLVMPEPSLTRQEYQTEDALKVDETETQASAAQVEAKQSVVDDNEIQENAELLAPFFKLNKFGLRVLSFEKDDDTNHHIDLIHAATNLRCRTYAIPELQRMDVKRISGKIIPAVATTTSAVAGLITTEFVKYAAGLGADDFRSSTMNLALSNFVMAVPEGPFMRKLSDHLSVSEWDRWEWAVPECLTLREFMDIVECRAEGLKIDIILEGDRMLNMVRRNLQLPISEILHYLDEDRCTYLSALFAPPLSDDVQSSDQLNTFQSPPIAVRLLLPSDSPSLS